MRPGDELFSADLCDAQAVQQALQGTEVAYLVAGLPYDTTTWQRDWSRIMDHVIEAAQRQGYKLVFFDNVYAYGQVNGAMTEATAFAPCSAKGEVRAQIAQTFVQAIHQGLPGMLVWCTTMQPGATAGICQRDLRSAHVRSSTRPAPLPGRRQRLR